MKNHASLEIACAREGVFAFLADDDNLHDIVPNLVAHRILKETPEKVGTTFEHVYEEKGRRMTMQGVVTEHQPPERMAVALDGPFFSMEVLYVLDALEPQRTRMTQTTTARFKHVFKLMGLLFRKKMECEGEKTQQQAFARIKERLEEDAGA